MKPKDPQELMAWGFAHGSVDDVRESLRLGANPNGPISNQWNVLPLYRSLDMSTSAVPMVECLLEHGADPSLSHNGANPPFHMAMMKGACNCAELMLNHADLLRRGVAGDLASTCATSMGVKMLELMQNRFEQHFMPAHPGLPRHHLWTDTGSRGLAAVHLVYLPEVAQWLFAHPDFSRADMLEVPDKNGRTPLWQAAISKRTEICRILLGLGAKTDVKNLEGIPFMNDLERRVTEDLKNNFTERESVHELMNIINAAHASQMANKAVDDLMSNHKKEATP
jgi:ankyrin repeat protein